jgi:phosphatidylglycerol lysyltransferase
VISQSDRTYAHLALLGDKALLFNEHRNAFIMYGAEGRSYVAMGDPVGPPDARRELAWEFRELCERLGTWTVFYQAHPENLDLYLELGLTLLKIGDEARVHLPGFSLECDARMGMRATRERLERDGYRMEVVPRSAVSAILPDLNQRSNTWLAQKRSREKGFSLGFFAEEYLTAGPVALVRQDDKTVAFANLWLGRDNEEFSIDLMRFVPEAPKDVEDYLLIELIQWGQAKRYKWFNLGMAPLTGLHTRNLAPRWNRFGAIAFGQGERYYNFQGLRQYKERFGPCWESRFLASPGGIALPHILANVTALIGGGLSRTAHQ